MTTTDTTAAVGSHPKSTNVTDKYVGARVRMRRLMVGMSQEKLAAALGLTFQQVQKYENGRNRIVSSRLQAIAQSLQVPVAFFFLGAPVSGETEQQSYAPLPDYINGFLSTSEGLALAKAFQSIKSRELRRSIVALVEELAAGGPAGSH